MPNSIVLIMLFLSLSGSPLLAEGKPLSLQEAISIALQHNPNVLRARYAVEEARGRRLQSEARPEPFLSLRTEGIPFNSNSAEPTEINLSFEQPIEFPGKRSLRAKVGLYGEQIASLGLESAQLVVTSHVKKAYWKAVLLERTVFALETLADLLDEMIDSSLLRYQAGTAGYGDVVRGRVEKARLRNDTIGARRERDAAKAALTLLLGVRSDLPYVLTTELTYVPFDLKLDEVKAAARESRPSFRIAALRAEQAEAIVSLAAKNRLPDFVLGLSFPSVRLNAWGVGLGLSLPLSRARTDGERLEASSLYESSLASEEAHSRRLDMLIETAYASVRAAEDQFRLFEQALLAEIEEELRSGLTQYQYGKIESYNLLDLYRAYAAAKIERLRALFLYLSGLADLEAAGEES